MIFRKYFPLVLVLISISLQLEGQALSKYDLLTESYVQRPLCMHKGQIQINSGYDLFVINAKYDQGGEKIDLKVDGTASAKHRIPIELKFGLLEYIQLSASTSFASMAIRNQSYFVYSSDDILNVSEISTYKGMSDLYLGTDLTAPFKWNHINWIMSAGISLPVFNHEPDKPGHTYTIIDTITTDLKYRYNRKYASGVYKGFVGSSLKLKFGKMSFTGVFNYSTGIQNGKSFDWNFRLVNDEFEYEKEKYIFSIGQTVDYHGEIAVQAISWFTLWSAFSGYRISGGWSDITGKKVGVPKESLSTLSVGFEILVSPTLRIEQQIVIPVSGKNVIAQLGFQTGFSMNFIPSVLHKSISDL